MKFPRYRKKITKVIAFFPILWCGGKLATLQCHVTQKIWNLPKSYINICSFTTYKYIHHNLYTKYVLCTLIGNMIFLFSMEAPPYSFSIFYFSSVFEIIWNTYKFMFWLFSNFIWNRHQKVKRQWIAVGVNTTPGMSLLLKKPQL